MRRYQIGAACLAGIALAAAAMGEGAGSGVLLRYHFQPGQEFRYRMTVNGDLPVTPGGGAVAGGMLLPAQIPTTMNGVYEWVQRVRSVSPEGAATVSLSVDQLNLTNSFLGMNTVTRLGANRKIETLMNGQPLPFGAEPGATLPDPLIETRLDATGKIAGTNGESARAMSRLFGGQSITSIFSGSMPGMGMLVFPEKPIRPGDTWDTTTQVQVSVSPPGPAGGGAAGGGAPGALVTETAAVHNKLLKVENGRAVIQTTVTTAAHPGGKTSLSGGPAVPGGISMSIDKLSQSATGTERFNVDQGVIEGGDFDLKISSLVTLGMPTPTPAAPPGGGAAPDSLAGAQPSAPASPPGAAAPPAAPAPPAGAPGAMRIGVDGTLKVKIERVTTPPAAVPPASHSPQ